MEVTFYKNFSKRVNSTKQPAAGTGDTYDIYLKEMTSLEAPTFIMDPGEIDYSYNYCQFAGSYYFVDDITLQNDHTYAISCTMDPMATFKSNIAGYTAYVERATSSYEELVYDNMISQKMTEVKKDSSSTDIGLNYNGCYVFRTESMNHGTCLYASTNLQPVAELFNQMLNTSGYSSSEEFARNLLSAGLTATNVSNYVNGLMWVPLDPTTLGALETGTCCISFWTLQDTGYYRLGTGSATQYYKTGAISIPTNYYTDFRAKSDNFSRYSLYLPGIGTVGLNAMDAAEGDLLYSMNIDLNVGTVMYVIRHPNGDIVGTYNGQLGVSMPIGSNSINTGTLFSSVVGVAKSVATEDYAGAAESALGGMNSISQPQTSFCGGSGNRGALANNSMLKVSLTNYGSMEFQLATSGRPLCKNVALSTLSGYVQCKNAAVEIPGFQSEMSAVNNYLNTGFYME